MADRTSVDGCIADHWRKFENFVGEISSNLNDQISYVIVSRNTSAMFYVGDHLYHQDMLYRQFIVSTYSNNIMFHTICHTVADANYHSSAI
jgi:hypothetical protein